MLDIISIENTSEAERSNEMLWKDLIIESYNKYRKYNDYSKSIEDTQNLKEFWRLVGASTIHIVLRQNKFIGFFLNTTHKNNKEISFKVFSHPLACPMSIRSVTKAALFRSFMLFLEDNSYTELEFTTWHPSLVSAIKRFIPDLQINLINSTTFICYKKVEKKDLRNFSIILSKYLNEPKQLKKNQYKILY